MPTLRKFCFVPVYLLANLFTSPQTDLFRNGTTCQLRDAAPDNLRQIHRLVERLGRRLFGLDGLRICNHRIAHPIAILVTSVLGHFVAKPDRLISSTKCMVEEGHEGFPQFMERIEEMHHGLTANLDMPKSTFDEGGILNN
jgi:hypothetical protein